MALWACLLIGAVDVLLCTVKCLFGCIFNDIQLAMPENVPPVRLEYRRWADIQFIGTSQGG